MKTAARADRLAKETAMLALTTLAEGLAGGGKQHVDAVQLVAAAGHVIAAVDRIEYPAHSASTTTRTENRDGHQD